MEPFFSKAREGSQIFMFGIEICYKTHLWVAFPLSFVDESKFAKRLHDLKRKQMGTCRVKCRGEEHLVSLMDSGCLIATSCFQREESCRFWEDNSLYCFPFRWTHGPAFTSWHGKISCMKIQSSHVIGWHLPVSCRQRWL